MDRRVMGFVPLVLVLASYGIWIGGCPNTTPELLILPPGGAVITTSGDQTRVQGNCQFRSAAGGPVNPPSGGAVVMIGTGTLAAGSDAQGNFDISGLPSGQGLTFRAGAEGFLPCFLTIPSGATEIPQGQIQLIQDTNPDDNPALTNERLAVGLDGLPRIAGQVPQGTILGFFRSAGGSLSTGFLGASGQLLQTEFFEGPTGFANVHILLSDMTADLPTGLLYWCLFSNTGFTVSTIRECQLTLHKDGGGTFPLPPHPDARITGEIRLDDGQTAATGAQIVVTDASDADNRFEGTTQGTGLGQSPGRFVGDLDEGPPGGAGTVNIFVEWLDTSSNRLYKCVFRNR